MTAAAIAEATEEMSDEQAGLLVRAMARRAAAARTDPVRLYEFVMREETSRRRLRIAPHQELIIRFILAHPKCVVRAPVGFGKTYVIIVLTLWFLGCDQTERGVVISAAQGQSKKVLDAVRRYIESSADLHLAFPELRRSPRMGDVWSQTALTVDRPPGIRDQSLRAIGIGGKLPGSRLSWINADDLLTLENTSSEKSREYTRHWVASSVLDRLDSVDSRIAITNVPWVTKASTESIGDITYELEAAPFLWPTLTLDAYGDVDIRNTDWDSDLIRPSRVGDDPEGVRHRLTAHDHPDYARFAGDERHARWVDGDEQVPLWPEVYPLAVLEEKRQLLAGHPGEFNRTFRCKPRDERTAAVKAEWIETAKVTAVRMGVHRSVASWPSGPPTFTCVDPAFGQKRRHDKTSILTFTVLPSMHRLILENQVGRWQGGEIASRTAGACVRFNSIAVVEGNAAQRWMKELIRQRNLSITVRTMTTGNNKHDPRFGVQSIFLEIEDGLWLLPNDGMLDGRGQPLAGTCPPGVIELVSDLLEYDANRHTSDSLMALWIGREYARRIGVLHVAHSGGGDGSLAALGMR